MWKRFLVAVLKNKTASAGHAALYTLIILPIAIGLTAVTISLTNLNSTGELIQSTIDRAAFQATYALPNKDKAETIAINAVQSANLPLPVQLAITFPDTSSIKVQAFFEQSPIFSGFINLFSNKEIKVSATKVGIAHIAPTDYVLILPDGATLRPELSEFGNSTPRFGSDYEARFFQSCATQFSLIPSKPPIIYDTKPKREWATKACFNDIFSMVKLAGVDVVDVATSVNTNRISVLFTPGDTSGIGFSFLRHLRDGAGGFFNDGSAQALWTPYREVASGLGDEACVLFSESANSNFALAQNPLNPPTCSGALNFSTCGGVVDISNSLNYSECYFNALQLRNAIYFRMAKLSDATFNALPNLTVALEQAYIEYMSKGDLVAMQKEVNVRGNLGYKPDQTIIAVTDVLPVIDSRFIKAVKQLRDKTKIINGDKSKLYIVALNHNGLTPALKNDLQNKYAQLEGLSYQLEQDLEFKGFFKVILADSPSQLRSTIIPNILSSAHEVYLSK